MEEAAIRNWSFGFQINFGRIAASSYPNINRVVIPNEVRNLLFQICSLFQYHLWSPAKYKAFANCSKANIKQC